MPTIIRMISLSCLALILVVPFQPAIGAEKSILVIESYHKEYPWDASYKRGIDSVLGDRHQIEYFEMDTKRRPSSEYKKRAELAWNKYKEKKWDLVILGDDNALKYLAPKFIHVNTPVVYLGINNNPRNYGVVGRDNITGVLERPLLKRSILYLRTLLIPKPKKVLVLFDNGTTAKTIQQEEFKGHSSLLLNDVYMDLALVDNFYKWKKLVLKSKKNHYDAIVFGLYHTIKDGSGNNVDAEEIIKWSSQHTPIPPFGFWDFSIGQGKAIGGLVLFGEEQGRIAANIACEILSGKRPGQIKPITAERGHFFFSKSELNRWKMTLPEEIRKKAEFTD